MRNPLTKIYDDWEPEHFGHVRRRYEKGRLSFQLMRLGDSGRCWISRVLKGKDAFYAGLPQTGRALLFSNG